MSVGGIVTLSVDFIRLTDTNACAARQRSEQDIHLRRC
jgi:hypothetical protein